MKINDRIDVMIPGIEYQVKINEKKSFFLSFIHKTKNGDVMEGLTNEDVLMILIHRVEKQNSDKSDHFNNKALYSLREALRNIEQRRYNMRNFKYKKKILNNE